MSDATSGLPRWARITGWTILGCGAALAGTVIVIGAASVAPRNQFIGPPPTDLDAEAVTFPSESGSLLHGWFAPGKPGSGAVVMLHGIRGSRRQMINRALWLSRAGYAVLLFDFQAHGESQGQVITFGVLESRDTRAAVQFMREHAPGEAIGVIGFSMGGACALLADPPLPVQALVLEVVYPTLVDAIRDRAADRAGGTIARLLTPLITAYIARRIGHPASALRPIDNVSKITVPKLFLAGRLDRHTLLAEAEELFARAAPPKELWILDKAAHYNLHNFAPHEYEARVGEFLARHLKR